MNIFASDISPEKSAIALDNKRVVKMILESAQMLSTALHFHIGTATYKPAFKNHPCTIWARKTRENYEWLLAHFEALCKEYTRRYNKQHKCEELLEEFRAGISSIKSFKLTPFADCTGEVVREYAHKNLQNAKHTSQFAINANDNDEKKFAIITDKYKLCLSLKWQNDTLIPKWSTRQKPKWYIN